ncbi:probable linoleate 9S-lipoxygenase 5 [Tanacetum coccineum]
MPRISRQRFASQVDEKNDLYLPNVRESAPAKPHHVNAPSSSRNSHKESYGSNDMAHTYFLEKGRKKTQDKTRIPNHKDMASTRAHCTPNAWSPKPRNIYRSFPVSKCSGGMSNVQSPMIRNNNPVEPKNHTHKPGRQIGIGQRFSLNKSSAMHEKPQTPRSCLRAFTASANVPSIYIQLFWNTLTHDAKTEALEITLPWTNIVLKPDLALELGKSISLTETEEEAVAREVHATHPQGKQEMSKRQPELEAQLKELDDNVGDDNEETGAWDDNDDLAEICGSRLVHFITLLIDQDEQSTSTSPTNQEIQSLQVSLSGPVPQFMAPDHSSSGPVLHEMDGLIKSVQTSRPIDKRRCFSKAFSDVEHAECIDTRKSTSGGIQFLGDKLLRPQVWELVDKPFGKTVIKLKWLWKNKKKDEVQSVIRNKAILVAKGTGHFGKTNVLNRRKIVFYRVYFRFALFQPHGEEISCHLLYASVEIPGKCVDRRLIGAFGRHTSSLLNANCKKALNLLRKGLLVQGEAKTTSKWSVSRQTEHLKMEIPCSNKIKFITACSFSNDSFEDIMKAQVSVIKASATLNIQAFKIKKSVSISFRMTQVHKMAKDHMMMIRDYDWMMISKKLKDHIQVKLKPKSLKEPTVKNAHEPLIKDSVPVVEDSITIHNKRRLQTHAAIESFIIATNRQLSILHPIHKLLHPHFRDTMNINGLSRQTLINAGLAVEHMASPHGVRLLIEDYPFAVDELEIWSAIKSWVKDYVFVYYKNAEDIQNDTQLEC